MDNIASANINTFGPSPKADFVPTSEQLITLTYGQLQDLVTKAIEKAIKPLQDEIAQIKDIINIYIDPNPEALDPRSPYYDALRASTKRHTKVIRQEYGTEISCLQDRVEDLEEKTAPTRKEPGKTELARVEKIKKHLATRPDHEQLLRLKRTSRGR